MAENANPPHVEKMLDCPTIFFDTVPTVGLRSNVISLTLAVHVGEPIAPDETKDHLVAVANLRADCSHLTASRRARQDRAAGCPDQWWYKLRHR